MSIVNDLFRYGIRLDEKLNLVWWDYVFRKTAEKADIGPPYGIVRKVIVNEEGAQSDDPALNYFVSTSTKNIPAEETNIGIKILLEIPTITDSYTSYIRNPKRKSDVLATFREVSIDRSKYKGRDPTVGELVKLKYPNGDLNTIHFDGYPAEEKLIDSSVSIARKDNKLKSKQVFNKAKGAK